MIDNKERWFSIQPGSLAAKMIYVSTLALVLIAVIHPDVRGQVRSLLQKDFRMVISTVVGDLRGDGSTIKVVKVKTRDSMFLEFYAVSQSGESQFLQRIDLEDKRDAYFNYNGEATNLALANVDDDGLKEILAPSFDQNLRAHLNVFHFDPNSGMFSHLVSTK